MEENTYESKRNQGEAQTVTRWKWSFLAVFVLVFVASTSVLAALDVLPEAQEDRVAETNPSLSAAASLAEGAPEMPTMIEIPALGRTVEIANPTSTVIATLDRALLDGAVRYPTSARLGTAGNVVVFGHSSRLPIVRNSAFKAFNDIEDLTEGDRILVTGTSRTYVYEVEGVSEASTEEGAIPLSVDGSKLTLATCDSFGKKSDRFIVTATLVESYPVRN